MFQNSSNRKTLKIRSKASVKGVQQLNILNSYNITNQNYQMYFNEV